MEFYPMPLFRMSASLKNRQVCLFQSKDAEKSVFQLYFAVVQ